MRRLWKIIVESWNECQELNELSMNLRQWPYPMQLTGPMRMAFKVCLILDRGEKPPDGSYASIEWEDFDGDYSAIHRWLEESTLASVARIKTESTPRVRNSAITRHFKLLEEHQRLEAAIKVTTKQLRRAAYRCVALNGLKPISHGGHLWSPRCHGATIFYMRKQ